MGLQLKLNVDQVSTAILLLDAAEKDELKHRLPILLSFTTEHLDDLEWLSLAESAFDFWNDPAEDIYNDLVPEAGRHTA